MTAGPRSAGAAPKFLRAQSLLFCAALVLMMPAEFVNLREPTFAAKSAMSFATAGRALFAAVAALYVVFRIRDLLAQRTWRDFGAWSALPTLAVIGWAVFGLTTIPVRAQKTKAPEAAQVAHQAGARAERAQDAYRAKNGRYADRLEDLVTVDPSIIPESDVTFRFTPMSGSGYAFSTRTPGSAVTYRWTSKKRDLERVRSERRRRIEAGEQGAGNDVP